MAHQNTPEKFQNLARILDEQSQAIFTAIKVSGSLAELQESQVSDRALRFAARDLSQGMMRVAALYAPCIKK